MPPSADTLVSALSELYVAELDSAGPLAALALRGADLQWLNERPHDAFDDIVYTLLSLSDLPQAERIAAARAYLPWGTSPLTADKSGEVAACYSVATLMGPEGPVICPDHRLGLFYQQPNTYYPLHIHMADETYVILAGRAIWTAGDDTRPRVPGDMIHHPSLMPHAFRTGPEGLLALWRWSGDIDPAKYDMVPDPALAAA